MKIYCSFFLLFAFPVFAQPLNDTPLARVGNITITSREFLNRFEMTPGFQRHNKASIEAVKAEFLLSMIAEKLLVLNAEQQNLETDSFYNQMIYSVERLLVRDELYRKEVSQKVEISEREIQEGIRRLRQDLKIYFLFAREKSTADSLYTFIKNGRPLESFTVEKVTSHPSFKSVDSAVARFGDTEEPMENVVYSLRLNETSKPFFLNDGYYLVKVMGKTINIVAGDKELKAEREKVLQIIRKRKELKRMSAFMSTELKNTKTEIVTALLKKILDVLYQYHKGNNRVPDTTQFFLGANAVEAVRYAMGVDFQKPLVLFPNKNWSVEQTLELMVTAGLISPQPTYQRLRIDFEQRLRDIIDQEYLTELGYQRNLNHSNEVRKDMKVWRDAYAAQYLRKRIADTVSLSQKDLEEGKQYFSSDSVTLGNPKLLEEKVKAIKVDGEMEKFIGALANETRLTIYEKNLKQLEVTRSPSLVFRFLGFGGRMFAVPFVIPQVGWIQYLKQGSVQLP